MSNPSKKPVVLIAGAPAFDRFFKDSAIMVAKTYPLALAANGAVPVLASDYNDAEAYAKYADGLLLTGSNQFAPDLGLVPKLRETELPKRNKFDTQIYAAFKRQKKPILGICLGFQVINVEEGGTSAVNFKLKDGVEHMFFQHEAKAVDGFLIYRLFGPSFWINSRHNNKIDILSQTLTATVFSSDGVIEAVEHKELPIWAVEWHPERMRGETPDPPEGPLMDPLFKFFI
jgi:putative glutamine amidotransferase